MKLSERLKQMYRDVGRANSRIEGWDTNLFWEAVRAIEAQEKGVASAGPSAGLSAISPPKTAEDAAAIPNAGEPFKVVRIEKGTPEKLDHCFGIEGPVRVGMIWYKNNEEDCARYAQFLNRIYAAGAAGISETPGRGADALPGVTDKKNART